MWKVQPREFIYSYENIPPSFHIQVCCITAHHWGDGYFISISVCGVWEIKTEIQVSRRELHTQIHLEYARVECYLISKKKKSLL